MKLYIYDHCPYCTKARMVFGIKNIKFDSVILLNDDEKTPISMIGAKMVPIFLEKEGDEYMPESMDIIYYIDKNYGKERVVISNNNQEIQNWLDESSQCTYKLAMPRWAKADLEEFKTKAAIDYFTKKKENYIGSFKEHLYNSASLINIANQHLTKLESILENHNYPQDQKITEADIHLFATLRSLSIVKGLQYPKRVDEYRKALSNLSKVNLHDNIAM